MNMKQRQEIIELPSLPQNDLQSVGEVRRCVLNPFLLPSSTRSDLRALFHKLFVIFVPEHAAAGAQ